jgi:hypothetical protein
MLFSAAHFKLQKPANTITVEFSVEKRLSNSHGFADVFLIHFAADNRETLSGLRSTFLHVDWLTVRCSSAHGILT